MKRRLFAAFTIRPDELFTRNLRALQAALKRDAVAWVPPGNLHLTLYFFGETPEEKIPAIGNALATACHGVEPFELTLSGLGIFGSRYQPRVIWIHAEPAEQLRNLQSRIVRELQPLGFVPDRQNFVPHLTLGRVKKINDLRHFQEVIGSHQQAISLQQPPGELRLYESTLWPEGAVYTVLQGFRRG